MRKVLERSSGHISGSEPETGRVMTSPLPGEDCRFESGQAHCNTALPAQRRPARFFDYPSGI